MWPLTFKPALGVPGEDGVWVSAAALRLWAVGPWAPAGDVVCSQPHALSSRLYPKTLPRLPEKSTARRLLLAFPLKSFPWRVKRERNLHFKADKPLTPSAVPGSSQLLAEGSLFFFLVQTQERVYFLSFIYILCIHNADPSGLRKNRKGEWVWLPQCHLWIETINSSSSLHAGFLWTLQLSKISGVGF